MKGVTSKVVNGYRFYHEPDSIEVFTKRGGITYWGCPDCGASIVPPHDIDTFCNTCKKLADWVYGADNGAANDKPVTLGATATWVTKSKPVIHLLNSAVMPCEGSYIIKAISQTEFVEVLQSAKKSGRLKSYIGYANTKHLIKQISGVEVKLSREQTVLSDGDNLLICKLKLRLTDNNHKADKNFQNALKVSDFEFFSCTYNI